MSMNSIYEFQFANQAITWTYPLADDTRQRATTLLESERHCQGNEKPF